MCDTPPSGQKTPPSDPTLTDKIRRWDDIRRNQFGIALTTFIALATGGVGYCAKLIADEHVNYFPGRASFWFVIAALAFGFGLIAGVLATLTRLRDFRLTAHKHHRKKYGAAPDELAKIKIKYRYWGRVSWRLLYGLIWCVFVGIISVTCCVFVMYHSKLFIDQPDVHAVKAMQAMPTAPASQTNN